MSFLTERHAEVARFAAGIEPPPARAFRQSGSQTRTAFQLHKASSGCPSSSSSEASAHRVRISVGQSVNRTCSRVTHLIHDVPGSDRVVGFGCGDVAPMFIALLAPLRFWLLPSRSLPSLSCRTSDLAYENRCRENAVDGSVNITEWAYMKLQAYDASEDGQCIPPSTCLSTAAGIADSDSSRASRHGHSCRISNDPAPFSRGTSVQTQGLRIRQGNGSDEGEFASNGRTERVLSPVYHTL